MSSRKKLYTHLQFGNEISNAVSFCIIYKKSLAPNALYVKLLRKDTNDLKVSICVPGHISSGVRIFPDGLVDYSGTEYSICIEGLTRMESRGNDVSTKLYESQTCCSTEFTANASAKGSKLQLTLNQERCGATDVGRTTLSKKKRLTISVRYEQSSTYVVTSNSLFPSLQMFFIELEYDGRRFIFTELSRGLSFRVPFKLLPKVVDPMVQVFVGQQLRNPLEHLDVWQIHKRREPFSFKTHLTTSQLQLLYCVTVGYAMASEMYRVPITYLWRTKPQQYWDNIYSSNKVMAPYRKDFNGDPRSIINGNIDGLFFSASVNTSTMQPSTSSWFGNKRINIKMEALIRRGFRMYFADFYCHYTVHYVTLVITKPGSKADAFCSAHLPEVNIENNCFLSRPDPCGPWIALASNRLHVEVFYTEPVYISEILHRRLGFFDWVQPQGRGHSNPNGIPKRVDCTICNI